MGFVFLNELSSFADHVLTQSHEKIGTTYHFYRKLFTIKGVIRLMWEGFPRIVFKYSFCSGPKVWWSITGIFISETVEIPSLHRLRRCLPIPLESPTRNVSISRFSRYSFPKNGRKERSFYRWFAHSNGYHWLVHRLDILQMKHFQQGWFSHDSYENWSKFKYYTTNNTLSSTTYRPESCSKWSRPRPRTTGIRGRKKHKPTGQHHKW